MRRLTEDVLFGDESHKLREQVKEDSRSVWPFQGIFGAYGANNDPLNRSVQAARSILVSPYGSRRGSIVSQPICASGREAHCLRSKVGLTSGEVQHTHTCMHTGTHSQALCECTCMMLFSNCMFGFSWRNLTVNCPGTPHCLADERMAFPSSLPQPAIFCASIDWIFIYVTAKECCPQL